MTRYHYIGLMGGLSCWYLLQNDVSAFVSKTTFLPSKHVQIRNDPLNINILSPLFASPSLSDPKSSSPEMIRHDIEEMKKEALARFDKLTIKMEEIKEMKKQEQQQQEEKQKQEDEKRTKTQLGTKKKTAAHTVAQPQHSLDSLEGDMTRQMQELQETEDRVKNLVNSIDTEIKHESVPATTTITKDDTSGQYKPESYDLLDETRWKISFSIGREAGTWMPPTWGVSGDRVLFQVIVDFTAEPLYDHEEFFQGISGTKQLDVVEAYLIPRGIGMNSVGRRPVPIKSKGGYKVCPGQGPLGTDLVRMYVDILEDVFMPDHESDVFCPKGRVYATCGYFVRHDSTERPNKDLLSPKDIAQKEYRDAVTACEQLQFEIDTDTRFFSLEKIQKMKDLYVAKNHVDETTKKLLKARQREPDKSQLRLSRKRDVGLSKDGGVCCKVQKGITLEYHILGRMEIGCVDDHKHTPLHQNHHVDEADADDLSNNTPASSHDSDEFA